MTWHKKITWNKKTIAIGISVVFFIAMGITYTIKNNSVKPKEVTIEKTIKTTLTETTTATGNIEAKYRNNIVLNSSQKVLEIAVKEGQLVKKGDVLLVLDSSDYQNQLEKLQINLENAKLTLNQMVQTGITKEKSVSD